MTAFEFLKSLSHRPSDDLFRGEASNQQLKRWLDNRSVRINNKFPMSNDTIEFPVTDLVYFPKGKRKTTFV